MYGGLFEFGTLSFARTPWLRRAVQVKSRDILSKAFKITGQFKLKLRGSVSEFIQFNPT